MSQTSDTGHNPKDRTARPHGMVHVPGGAFQMGSNDFYPEEGPVHRVAVDEFWMDEHPVTNAEFRRFIQATAYITVAERRPDPRNYRDVDPTLLVSGSLVFRRPPHRVSLGIPAPGGFICQARAGHPEGIASHLQGGDHRPVVHVAYEDAKAYADWAGKSLPTEAEWEFAARSGLEGAKNVWGDEFAPEGQLMANTWQGEFSWQNLMSDGYEGASPVGVFPPNDYGLFDMAGNVWE